MTDSSIAPTAKQRDQTNVEMVSVQAVQEEVISFMPQKRRTRRSRDNRHPYNILLYCVVAFCFSLFIYIMLPSRYTETELRLKGQNLTELPDYVMEMKNLKFLDVGSNQFSSLPDDFAKLQSLEILFCSDNLFETYPTVLNQLPNLYMVSFKNNRISFIPEEAFEGPYVNINWLILTGNRLPKLPRSIGKLRRMKKFMLANNHLRSLPEEMISMQDLELIRLANNNLEAFPETLRELPNLTWVALADNNFNRLDATLPADLRINPNRISEDEGVRLGAGASGIVQKKHLEIDGRLEDVAVKYFKKDQNSDGRSINEILITLESAYVESDGLMKCYGYLDSDPNRIALVFEFMNQAKALGEPPSFISCTRDVYPANPQLSLQNLLSILLMTGRIMRDIHSHEIIHGDFYAHNILVNEDYSTVKLSDFGAAWKAQDMHAEIAKIWDTRAFRKLVEDLLPFSSLDSMQKKKLGDIIYNDDSSLKQIITILETF